MHALRWLAALPKCSAEAARWYGQSLTEVTSLDNDSLAPLVESVAIGPNMHPSPVNCLCYAEPWHT